MDRFASKIGNPLPESTVGDLERARTSRLVEAHAFLDRTGLAGLRMGDTTPDQRKLITVIGEWVEQGGPPPWEPKPSPASVYPPREPQ